MNEVLGFSPTYFHLALTSAWKLHISFRRDVYFIFPRLVFEFGFIVVTDFLPDLKVHQCSYRRAYIVYRVDFYTNSLEQISRMKREMHLDSYTGRFNKLSISHQQ